jgi:hypothetical protein
MPLGFGKAGQIEEEQRSIDAMYARLDADLSTTISAHERSSEQRRVAQAGQLGRK